MNEVLWIKSLIRYQISWNVWSYSMCGKHSFSELPCYGFFFQVANTFQSLNEHHSKAASTMQFSVCQSFIARRDWVYALTQGIVHNKVQHYIIDLLLILFGSNLGLKQLFRYSD